MAELVSCTFYRPSKTEPEMAQHDVRVPSGLAGKANGLRTAACNFALDRGATHWAQPDLVVANGSWLVFRHERDVPIFCAKLPTRDAAEMWMLHRGD